MNCEKHGTYYGFPSCPHCANENEGRPVDPAHLDPEEKPEHRVVELSDGMDVSSDLVPALDHPSNDLMGGTGIDASKHHSEFGEKPIIGLDFDGVLHSYKSGWLGEAVLEEPNPGAQDFCAKLMDLGFRLVVCSSRAQYIDGLQAIDQWLTKHDFPEGITITNAKGPFVLLVDDRGFRFEGDFGTVLSFIKINGTDPWTKRHAVVD